MTPYPGRFASLVPQRVVQLLARSVRRLGGPDRVLAALLALLVTAQLTVDLLVEGSVGRHGANAAGDRPVDALAYVLVLLSTLPVAVRRVHPVPVAVVTCASGVAVVLLGYPATSHVLGPVFALYTVASIHGGRRALPLVLGVPTLASAAVAWWWGFSTQHGAWRVAQLTAMSTVLLLVLVLGDVSGTRRELRGEAARAREAEAARRRESERLAVAREVHDIMAHSLTLITVQAQAAQAALDTRPDLAREALGTIAETGRTSLHEVRVLLDVLTRGDGPGHRSPVPDLAGLDALVGAVRETGLEVGLERRGALDTVPVVAAVAAYRIVQECLTNVVRHAHARHVEVVLDATATHLSVQVHDDGRGLPHDLVPGRGLRGMHERAEAVGGSVSVTDHPHGGCHVTALLPTHGGT